MYMSNKFVREKLKILSVSLLTIFWAVSAFAAFYLFRPSEFVDAYIGGSFVILRVWSTFVFLSAISKCQRLKSQIQ